MKSNITLRIKGTSNLQNHNSEIIMLFFITAKSIYKLWHNTFIIKNEFLNVRKPTRIQLVTQGLCIASVTDVKYFQVAKKHHTTKYTAQQFVVNRKTIYCYIIASRRENICV